MAQLMDKLEEKLAKFEAKGGHEKQVGDILEKMAQVEPIITPPTDPVITPPIDPIINPPIDPVITPPIDPIVTPPTDPIITPPSPTVSTGTYYAEGLEITTDIGTFNYGPGWYHFGTSSDNSFIGHVDQEDIFVFDFGWQDGSFNSVGNDTIDLFEAGGLDDIVYTNIKDADGTSYLAVRDSGFPVFGNTARVTLDFSERDNSTGEFIGDLGLLTILNYEFIY